MFFTLWKVVLLKYLTFANFNIIFADYFVINKCYMILAKFVAS